MTKLAVGLRGLQLFRVLRSDRVDTFVIDAYNFFMRKFFLGKRRFYMALSRTIDALRHRIMRNFGNVSMAVTAFDAPVNTVTV